MAVNAQHRTLEWACCSTASNLIDYLKLTWKPRSSLEFSLEAIAGSAALKLVPTPRRVVVLAAQCMRVNVRRRPDRGVPQALGNHR